MIKNIIQKIKSERRNRQFQFSASLYLYGCSVTGIYSIFYLCMKIYFLTFWSATSALLFLCCFFLMACGYSKIAMLMGAFSTVCMSFLGDFTFGWNYGTHFFLVCLIPLILATEIMSKKTKLVLCSLCAVTYFVMLQFILHSAFLHPERSLIINIIGDINLFVSFGVLGFAMIRYSSAVIANERKLELINSKMAQLANTDQLTRIPNRRCIYNVLNSELAEYEQSNGHLVIGLVDVDDFKKINDTYGHLIGDQVLIELANQIQNQLREHDMVGRWGGEEFLIVLPETNLEKGLEILEKIRKSLVDMKIDSSQYQPKVTITIGVAEYKLDLTFRELISQADECLYLGKKEGKNCVIAA